MRKLLIAIKVISVRPDKRKRLNPYNPLTYATIICILIVALFMFGFVGMWREIDYTNSFKWQ